jgi:hypothetical protein
MALVLKDRVKESTTTSGTGTVVLLGAATGYQSFAVIGNNNQTYYAIAGGSDWEVGIGTYYSGNTSLSRDTILASSNANAAVTLSGTYDVFVTYPAEEAVYLDGGNNIYANGSSNISFVALTANVASINTVTLTSGTISATPNAATDIVNKTYVDALVSSGVHYHTPVQYEIPASQGNLVAIYNQPNGAGNGVGATLTNNGANAAFVADGNTVVISDRILVYNQSNAVQNGVYVVTVVGAPDSPGPGSKWVLTRSDDTDTYGFDSPQALSEGSTFFVQGGTTGKGETYTCNTPGTITFGTSNISFVQVSSAQIYSAGTGLTLSNTTFSISNTAVTSGTYGDAGNVATFTVNAQGQITNAVNTTITIPSSSVTGLGSMALQNSDSISVTGGTINGTTIGAVNPYAGHFSSLSASGTVSGVGFSNYLNSPPSIGGVTANTGAFTSLAASGTVSGSGFVNYFASPPAIGGTAANAASFTTISGDGFGISNITAANITAGTLTVPRGGTGLGSLTNNSVILGNGTSEVKFVAPGTVGNVLTSDGTTWTSSTPAASGLPAVGNTSIGVFNVNITANANIAAGQNGLSVGPVATANGVTVSVASGQRWVII